MTNPISLKIPAGSATAQTGWITVPVDAGTTYVITETSNPAGWTLQSSSNTSITINTDEQEETAVFTNEKGDDPEDGCIAVHKTTDENVPIGSIFEFSISPGGFSNIYITTGDNRQGSNKFCGLEIGTTYTVTEVTTGFYTEVSLTGPSAYSPGTSGLVTVPEEGDGQIWFYNDPGTKEKLGTIGIEKVDAAGRKLFGAGFTLYNSDKSAVVRAQEMVDAAGRVAFRKLPLGTYVVAETTLPPGVITGMADVKVTIDEGNVNRVINITAVNTNGGGDGDGDGETTQLAVLALTGFNTAYYIAGFLMMLFGVIGSIYLTRALRRRKE